MADDKKTITIGLDALDALIQAKVDALMAQSAQGQQSRDPLTKRMLENAQATELKVEYFECESPATGARFKAMVVSSRAYPLGRIQTLEEYAYPAGVDKHVCDGGLVPDGSPIFELDERGRTTDRHSVQYRTWRTRNFYIADLASFVGKPYQPYFSRVEADKRRADLAARERAAQAPAAA